MNKQKHWYDYLWIVTPIYLGLGFFNILFAWLGMIFFCLPLLIAIFGGSKLYCNRYCDRGQFLSLLGGRLKLSRNKPTPRWMRTKAFRYGFLVFFFLMFFQMLFTTYLVGAGAKDIGAFVKLFWTFQVPWHWAYHGTKPRTWCVFCPMGTMTQLLCTLRSGKAPAEGCASCSGCRR